MTLFPAPLNISYDFLAGMNPPYDQAGLNLSQPEAYPREALRLQYSHDQVDWRDASIHLGYAGGAGTGIWHSHTTYVNTSGRVYLRWFQLDANAVAGAHDQWAIKNINISVGNITNLHTDTYGSDMDVPMQGPFTEELVGGLQSRHVAALEAVVYLSETFTSQSQYNANNGLNPAIWEFNPYISDYGTMLRTGDGTGIDPRMNNWICRLGGSGSVSPARWLRTVQSYALPVEIAFGYAQGEFQDDGDHDPPPCYGLDKPEESPADEDLEFQYSYDGVNWLTHSVFLADDNNQGDDIGWRIQRAFFTQSVGRDSIEFKWYQKKSNSTTGQADTWGLDFVRITNGHERPEGWKFANNKFTYPDVSFYETVPESGYISGSLFSPHATYYREPLAKRPVNIQNKKVASLGNYSQDYEIFQTCGRTSNNLAIVSATGSEAAKYNLGPVKNPFLWSNPNWPVVVSNPAWDLNAGLLGGEFHETFEPVYDTPNARNINSIIWDFNPATSPSDNLELEVGVGTTPANDPPAGNWILKFRGNASTPDARTLTTSGSFRCPFTLSFKYARGDWENALDPGYDLEAPEVNENFGFFHSVDDGATWIQTDEFSRGTSGFPSYNNNIAGGETVGWYHYERYFPAESGSVKLRWQQVQWSVANNDNWALDDVRITVPNEAKIQRGAHKNIFVNRFSAPGGWETQGDSDGGPGLDIYAAEFSVYNSMNWRNREVRRSLNLRLASHVNQFGFFSAGAYSSGSISSADKFGTSIARFPLGSVIQGSNINPLNYSGTGSISRVNRNTTVQGLQSWIDNNAEGFADASNWCSAELGISSRFCQYDNYYVQRNIPSTDFGYAWIRKVFGRTATLSTYPDLVNNVSSSDVGSSIASPRYYGDERLECGNYYTPPTWMTYTYNAAVSTATIVVVDVNYDSSTSVSGAQDIAAFQLRPRWSVPESAVTDPSIHDDVPLNFMAGGEAASAGWTVGFVENRCYGVSMVGTPITAISGVLIQLTFPGFESAFVSSLVDGEDIFSIAGCSGGVYERVIGSNAENPPCMASGECHGLGDINGDGNVNVSDAILVVNDMLIAPDAATASYYPFGAVPFKANFHSYITGTEGPGYAFAGAECLYGIVDVIWGGDYTGSFAWPPLYDTIEHISRPFCGGPSSQFIPVDFVGLNSNIYDPVDISTDNCLLGYEPFFDISPSDYAYKGGLIYELEALSGSAKILNGIINHRQGAYGWPSWKQIRVGEHPIVRQWKGNSLIDDDGFGIHQNRFCWTVYEEKPWGFSPKTICKEGYTNPFGRALVKTYPSRWTGLVDVHQSFNPKPLAAQDKEYSTEVVSLQFEYLNNINDFNFENKDFYDVVPKCAPHTTAYPLLSSLYLNGAMDSPNNPVSGFVELVYKKLLFPAPFNTYSIKVRTRLGFKNTFWKSSRLKRTVEGFNKFIDDGDD
jgi:hypothetical protein